MKAITWKSATRVQQLIAQGSDVNSKHSHRGGNYQDVTPLMLAAEQGTPGIVGLLLSAGADLEARNRAIMEDDSAGHRDTALNFAIRRGNRKIIQILLDAGADVNGGGASSDSPLIQAIEGDDSQLAKMLLAKGANVNRRSGGNTPLHRAVMDGKLQFVKLLIDHGADLDATGVTGDSPLMLAANDVRRRIFNLLVDSGANIHARSQPHGWTALMWAVRAESLDIVRLLLKLGADVRVKNRNGRTALALAEELLRPWRQEPEEIARYEMSLRRTGDSVAAFRNGYRSLEKILALLKKRLRQ